MHLEIKHFEVPAWPKLAASLIQDSINTILLEQGHCSVMLTGGSSAARLYKDWSEHPAFQQLRSVSFYFGDERCVPPDDTNSNYGMTLRTLFQRGVPENCSVFHMQADDPDREAAALRYDVALPEAIDVMFLGVGEDGHIASLFPRDAALLEASRRVVPVTGPKPPFDRLTITPAVIAQARSIFVLAAGPAKAAILAKARKSVGDFFTLPACLALDATWLLDSPYPGDDL